MPQFDWEILSLGLMALTFNAFMIYVVVFRLNLFLTDAHGAHRSAFCKYSSAYEPAGLHQVYLGAFANHFAIAARVDPLAPVTRGCRAM